MTTRTAKAWLLGSAATALLVPGAALAAETATAEVAVQEIVVTAQRRTERLKDVPMAVTVVSQGALSSLGLNSVRDLQAVTTGFQLNNSGSVPQPAIRGVTTTNAGSYENNVALFLDGLYQPTPQILNMDLPNVGTIQILKGPQGTLYGRNATGGAILIDTVEPGAVWTGNVEATYGRFEDKRARGFVAGPLTDRIGLSLAGTWRETGGYYKVASRTTPGSFSRGLGLEQESIRGKLTFELTESLRATVGYNYIHADDPRGVFFTPIENVNTNYVAPGRNTRPAGLGEAAGDVFVNDFKQHEGFLRLELATGIGEIRSITGYTVGETLNTYDTGGSYVPDVYIDSKTGDKTWQQTIDYRIDAIDKLDLVIGGNYYNIQSNPPSGHSNNGTVFLGPALISPFTYPDPATTIVPLSSYVKSSEGFYYRTKEAWALFVDGTIRPTSRLRISLGGRYSRETQRISGLFNSFVTSGPNIGDIAATPYNRANSARSSTYSKFTPRAAIVYELTPRTNVYASYSQGFRSGEWNQAIPNNDPRLWVDAKPETIDAFELGLKSSAPRLRYEVSAFFYDYKNLQVSGSMFVAGAIPVLTLQNAPKAEIYGVDASFDFDVTENLKVRAGSTWLHARYGDRFVYIGTGVNPNVVGFNVSSDPLKTFVNAGAVAQDLSGLQMARAPDFSAFVGAEYNFPIQDGGVRLAANLKYTDSYVVTDPSVWGGEPNAAYNARKALDPNALPNNTVLLAGTPYVARSSEQRARQGSFVLLSASATWSDPTDHYYVRVWGTNLTDARYRLHYRPSGATYIPMAEPRSYGATIGYKF